MRLNLYSLAATTDHKILISMSELIADFKHTGQHAVAHARKLWATFGLVHKVVLIVAAVGFGVMGIVMLIYHKFFLELLVNFAKKWKELPGGGFLLFSLLVLVSFPPLIGYSALSSLCGMIYGFPMGWPFLTLATLIGSGLSFVTFRYFLSGYAKRMATENGKFAALTRALEQDRFTLLWMIRLCPLPYSLSNGALSSIPSVTLFRFLIATGLVSPKLFIHIFIGDRLVQMGTEKDTTSKIVDFISIGIASVATAATMYIIYKKTMQRAHVEEYVEVGDTTIDDLELSDNVGESDEEDLTV